MTRRISLRCSSCGEGFSHPSPLDAHGDPCGRCSDGMLVFSKQIDDKLQRVCDETYVSVGISALEQYVNGVGR